MLQFDCIMCNKVLREPGAILFAPPEKFEYVDEGEFYAGMVQKHHICADCYMDLITWIKMDYKK